MAKLNGPLLSIEARGSLGPRLTFSMRRSGPQVRFQRAQADVITSARTLQRSYFSMAAGWWGELSQAEQDDWIQEGNNP